MSGGHGNEQLTTHATQQKRKHKNKNTSTKFCYFFSTNKLSTQVEYWLVQTEKKWRERKKNKK